MTPNADYGALTIEVSVTARGEVRVRAVHGEADVRADMDLPSDQVHQIESLVWAVLRVWLRSALPPNDGSGA
jgi:hypothetical protein